MLGTRLTGQTWSVQIVLALHASTETCANLRDLGRVVVVGRSLHNGLGVSSRVARVEDTGSTATNDISSQSLLDQCLLLHEDTIAAELHAERRIGRSSNTACSKVHDRQATLLGDLSDELDRGLDVLRVRVQVPLRHDGELADFGLNSLGVPDSFNDVTSSSLACVARRFSANFSSEREGMTDPWFGS